MSHNTCDKFREMSLTVVKMALYATPCEDPLVARTPVDARKERRGDKRALRGLEREIGRECVQHTDDAVVEGSSATQPEASFIAVDRDTEDGL